MIHLFKMRRDLTGLMAVLGFLALALALLVLGLMEPDEGDRTEILRAVVVPAIIGAAILLFTRLSRPKGAAGQ